MSTPTADGVIGPRLGITEPTVEPLATCAIGINAICVDARRPRRARRLCHRAVANTPLPTTAGAVQSPAAAICPSAFTSYVERLGRHTTVTFTALFRPRCCAEELRGDVVVRDRDCPPTATAPSKSSAGVNASAVVRRDRFAGLGDGTYGGVTAVHRLGRRRDLRGVMHLRDVAMLRRLGERHDRAGSAGPRGVAGAVQVVLVIVGRVEVHDQVDVVDVQSAGGDIGGDEHPAVTRAERLQRADALVLVEVAVDRAGARRDPRGLGPPRRGKCRTPGR